uniref:Uncharacterized protein n=1 Tax=Parascaris univalens TaxID=6257 RepID=A0A915A7Z8_PARUN
MSESQLLMFATSALTFLSKQLSLADKAGNLCHFIVIYQLFSSDVIDCSEPFLRNYMKILHLPSAGNSTTAEPIPFSPERNVAHPSGNHFGDLINIAPRLILPCAWLAVPFPGRPFADHYSTFRHILSSPSELDRKYPSSAVRFLPLWSFSHFCQDSFAQVICIVEARRLASLIIGQPIGELQV